MMALAGLALTIWVYLIAMHGRFWQSGPCLRKATLVNAPFVAIVVPARDEAAVIDQSLRSILQQDYPGTFRIILVDDNSTDNTAIIARAIDDPRLTILHGSPRPPGWSGKLWAVQQGLLEAGTADLILLADADVVHDPAHLQTLVGHLVRNDLDLVSEMVTLACTSPAERILVPAFVFFFQLLYPFSWVNDRLQATAAAAGGTMLIQQRALRRIGGLECVRGALIDDVALASAVKKGGSIWLGHATMARSIRPYASVQDIWRMITRTAYVQLRYSPLLLIATSLAMAVTWLIPPLIALFCEGPVRWVGLLTWAIMTLSYVPTLRRFGRSVLVAPMLPLVAAFYMAATIGSAANHYRGHGVAWKGRAYQRTSG